MYLSRSIPTIIFWRMWRLNQYQQTFSVLKMNHNYHNNHCTLKRSLISLCLSFQWGMFVYPILHFKHKHILRVVLEIVFFLCTQKTYCFNYSMHNDLDLFSKQSKNTGIQIKNIGKILYFRQTLIQTIAYILWFLLKGLYTYLVLLK